MAAIGLRELKKARTRQLIADTAARLLAERGYEHVAVTDVARAAEVAEQTVYNYFPTKEQLVTDREQQIQDRLCDLIRSRPPAATPTVHRLALELTDRQALALAGAISDTSTVAPEIARLQGIALAGVFQIIISEAGQRARDGRSQAEIANELRPIVENVLDELDRWFSA
jgi:AcrR family transcriptional regulator